MAYTFRAATSAGNSSGGALSINKPTGTADGDLLVVCFYLESDTNTFSSTPSGWTNWAAGTIANTGLFKIWVFWKIASGEGASWSWTPTSSNWRSAVCCAYSGGPSSGNPQDVAGTAQADSVVATSQTAPSVTTTAANDLLTFNYGNYAGYDVTTTTGAASNVRVSLGGTAIADAVIASAGATGTTYPGGVGTQSYAASHTAFFLSTGVNGQSAITLSALTASATGTLALAGSGTITLGALTSSATGAVSISGQAAITLGSVTSTATGAVAIAGQSDIALDALTANATGALSIVGQLSATLESLSAASVGVLSIAGQASVTLGDVTTSATGALAIVGAANITLGDATATATGALPIVGQAAIALDALTLTATGELAAGGTVTGQASITLGALTTNATGTLTIAGAGSINFAELSATSTAVLGVAGQTLIAFDALAVLATGALSISGRVDTTLGYVTLVTAGGNGQNGIIDVTDTWPRVPGEVIDQTAPLGYARARGNTAARTTARNPKRIRG